jgi:glycosyltransferase involved in cell wall biosynthesis
MGVQDGVDYALQALHDLIYKRGRIDVSLMLIGDGDQLSYQQQLAHNLKLDEYVTFTGWVNKQEMLRYLSTADIGISPDPSNELNDHCTMLKTMEYMAMAKPVVAFDLPETRYSAQDAALYATPNQVEAFANQIEILLENAELRQVLGARGRRRIEEELCWEETQKNLGLAYHKLFPTYTAMSQSQETSNTDVAVIDTTALSTTID